MKKIFQILFFVIATVNVSFAQKLTAGASKTRVAVGETFQISFSLNASGSNFKAPNLNDFDVYSGPNQSTSMSFINGVMSQSITLSYIVAAKKEGKLTIGPASVVAGGNTIQSNAITIEAVKGSSNAGSPGNNNQMSQEPSAPTENIGDNLFVRTNVSKTKVVQGEQITVTHKVYTRYQLRGFKDIKFPDYNGFWAQDQPMNNQQIQVTNENIDGVVYNVAELKRSYIFPQRSGKLQIEPMVAEVVVRKQSNKKPRDIFEQFFGGGGYEDASYSVKSPSVTIDVQPLPEVGKTSSFSGAVGDYSYKVELSKNSVKANEGIDVIITLTGKGNIKLVEAPKINFPEDFETYDPKIKDNISVGANGVSGTKTFDYLFIPRHEGDYKLNDLSFTFFNPAKNEYITIPSPELSIHVEKGDESSNAAANVYTPNRKEDLKVLGNDIRYIKSNDLHLKNKDDYFFGSLKFYTGIISPFLAFIFLLVFRKKREEQNKDQVAVKSRKATKMAKKRLSQAEAHLASSNKEAFYLEISQSLYGYIGDRFNIPGADLSKENISGILKNRSVSEETTAKLISTLDNCEFARYAPGAVSADLQSIYNDTVELITKIEHEIK